MLLDEKIVFIEAKKEGYQHFLGQQKVSSSYNPVRESKTFVSNFFEKNDSSKPIVLIGLFPLYIIHFFYEFVSKKKKNLNTPSLFFFDSNQLELENYLSALGELSSLERHLSYLGEKNFQAFFKDNYLDGQFFAPPLLSASKNHNKNNHDENNRYGEQHSSLQSLQSIGSAFQIALSPYANPSLSKQIVSGIKTFSQRQSRLQNTEKYFAKKWAKNKYDNVLLMKANKEQRNSSSTKEPFEQDRLPYTQVYHWKKSQIGWINGLKLGTITPNTAKSDWENSHSSTTCKVFDETASGNETMSDKKAVHKKKGFLSQHSLSIISKKIAHKQVIFVGAGASVDDHLESLKMESRHKFVITVVGMYANLTKSGVKVDAIISTDPGNAQTIHFQSLSHSLANLQKTTTHQDRGIVVFTPLSANAISIRQFFKNANEKKNVFFFIDERQEIDEIKNYFVSLGLQTDWLDEIYITFDCNVALSAIRLLYHFGFDDISIYGANFNFSYYQFYSKLYSFQTFYLDHCNRLSPVENYQTHFDEALITKKISPQKITSHQTDSHSSKGFSTPLQTDTLKTTTLEIYKKEMDRLLRELEQANVKCHIRDNSENHSALAGLEIKKSVEGNASQINKKRKKTIKKPPHFSNIKYNTLGYDGLEYNGGYDGQYNGQKSAGQKSVEKTLDSFTDYYRTKMTNHLSREKIDGI